MPFPPSRPEGAPKIDYLGRDIILREKWGRLVAQHPIPFSWRPAFTVPQTAGFVKGIVEGQKRLGKAAPITNKPVYVLSSYGDETLDHEETVKLSQEWLSTNLELTELRYNYHDVFLGVDPEDELAAIELAPVWIACVLLGESSSTEHCVKSTTTSTSDINGTNNGTRRATSAFRGDYEDIHTPRMTASGGDKDDGRFQESAAPPPSSSSSWWKLAGFIIVAISVWVS